MQKERKQETDIILKEYQKKIYAEEEKTSSLEDFKEWQKDKNRRREKQSKANKAMSNFLAYLKSHNIDFETDCEDGIPRITMTFKNCERCPGRITEGCIYFYEDCMEVRVYYSASGANICKESENLNDLYRLLNFLHARLWPRVTDGMDGTLYSSQFLICPRFYVTEDGMNDITATMLIPYTHFELDMLEIEDFITAALPDLLDSLSIPVFFLLVGKITTDEAIHIVEIEILGGGDRE